MMITASRAVVALMIGWVAMELYEDNLRLKTTTTGTANCATDTDNSPSNTTTTTVMANKNTAFNDDDPSVRHNLMRVQPRPRNLELIFIGDSVTRFQYLSMVHWLKFGMWLQQQQQDNDTTTTTNYLEENSSRSSSGHVPNVNKNDSSTAIRRIKQQQLHQQKDSLIHAHSFHHEWHPQDDWNEFFLHSNRLLHPFEMCDCWREEIIINNTTTGALMNNTPEATNDNNTNDNNDNTSSTSSRRRRSIQIERRYFYEPTRNNKVVFINLYGNETDSSGAFQGYLDPTEIEWKTTFRPGLVGGSNRTWHRDPRNIAWSFSDWSQLIRHHVGRLGFPNYDDAQNEQAENRNNPSATTTTMMNATLILNAGLHQHNLDNETVADALHEALLGLLKSNSSIDGRGQVLWKTTTLMRDDPIRQQYQQHQKGKSANVASSTGDNSRRQDWDWCRLRKSIGCLNISWTERLGDESYLDRYHFVEPVYRILNEQLLDQLNVLPEGYERLDMESLLF